MDLHYFFPTIFALLMLKFVVGMPNLCEGASKLCDCFANKQARSIQLQCPVSTYSDVKVMYKADVKLVVECFNSTYNLNTLDLKMSKVETLELHKCKAANLGPQTGEKFFGQLQNNTYLKAVTVQQASLKNVDVDDLYKHIRRAPVEKVYLNDNELEEFPHILSNLPELYHLELNNNLIMGLPKKINFPNLLALFLINNSINHLDSEVFESAPKLLYIDLSKNKITNLPATLLRPLPSLRVLILNWNNFQVIPNGFFERNTLLRDVRLSDGNLTEIGAYIFSKFTQLEKLKLANNLLRTLPQNVFANLSRLDYLDIGNNLIENLPDNTFKSLRNLKYLFLFHNKLTEWSQGHNEDLVSLEELHLKSNYLSKIEATTFSGLSKLKKLDLRRNRISEIHPEAFDNLKELDKLDLSSNNLTEIYDTMDVLIAGINRSMSVDLSNNHVSHIKAPANYRSLSLSNPRTYSILIFKQNPFDCDCENYEFIRFLQASVKTRKLRTSGSEECASPVFLKGVKLRDVDLKNFTCFDGCPANCDCKIDPEINFLSVDCSNANFAKAPSIPRLITRSMEGDVEIVPEKIEVNLENNLIEEFAKDISYENVTILNLSSNKLVKIDWIPPQIEVLNLNNNMITSFDNNTRHILNASETLRLLTLTNNPWQCDCKMMEFVNALRTSLMRTIPNITITCSDGFPLLDLYEEKACFTISTFLIVLIVILSLIVLLSVILVILYFRYEDHVKIWLYNHKLLSFLISRSDDFDPDVIYDAFISYSHKDEEFVADCLVPKLEQCPEKYKICVHTRDWIVGEYIPKQIADSVRNSRRTIIVLSRNYLYSEWSNMEFKVAHDKSMNEERTRLIIILYEDVDLDEISNAELRTYLSTNTYIKWGDPWFWKKLRNSMPSNRKYYQKKLELERTNDNEKSVDT